MRPTMIELLVLYALSCRPALGSLAVVGRVALGTVGSWRSGSIIGEMTRFAR
jgi:hypothetical protein